MLTDFALPCPNKNRPHIFFCRLIFPITHYSHCRIESWGSQAALLSGRAGARDLLHAGPGRADTGAATLSATARRLRQTPLMHCTPGKQRWPHAPQVAGSLFRSLQTPLQQAALPPGAVPHCPQLAGSLSQFTHAPLQQYWPLRQLFEQLPQKEQDVPCPPRRRSHRLHRQARLQRAAGGHPRG